jgi:hypothetical protein
MFWKAKSGAKFDFYTTRENGKSMCEHAVIETSSEKFTGDILKKYSEIVNVKF